MLHINFFRPHKLRSIIYSPSTGGVILILASALAIVMANTHWQHEIHIKLHDVLFLRMSITHWINDGLMSIFFLSVGLEIKEELSEGQLSHWGARALPGVAALGGMIVPALIFTTFNLNNSQTLKGWAIPSATDIAFALTAITLLGKHVPTSLRTFLTTLAIIDDLGAILIIACFYTQSIEWSMLSGAAMSLLVLMVFNRLNVQTLTPYLLVGVILWYCMSSSGLHATLAGALMAFCIPIKNKKKTGVKSPLHLLKTILTPCIVLLVLPLFGFANAGITLDTTALHHALAPISLGITLGLLVGKPLGIFGMSWVAIKLHIAPMPYGASWLTLLATAMLCGIGFTMSLFIGGLAYGSSLEYLDEVKIGVLAGSLLSTLLGVIFFRVLISRSS